MALHHDVNTTKNDGAGAVAALVDVLAAAGHAIYAYGTGASGSRVAGGGGFSPSSLRDVPRAWVTVALAGGAGYVTFQRSDAGAGDNASWWVAHTRGALASDGAGATVDSPAASNDTKNVWGTPSAPAQLFPPDDAAVGWRFHCAAQGAAPYGWWCHAANVGTGEGRTLLAMDPVAAHPSDQAPYVFIAQCRNGPAWAGMFELAFDFNVGGVRCWHKRGMAGAAWVVGSLAPFTTNYGVLVPRYLGLNPYDGKDELVFPFHAYDLSGVRYLKGVSLMIAYAGSARPNQHTFDPDVAGDDRIVVGDLTLPWPAGVAAVV